MSAHVAHYRATHRVTGEVVEYDGDPLAEHVNDPWRLEEVGEAQAPPDAGPPDMRVFGGRRTLTKLDLVSLLGASFKPILAASDSDLDARAFVKMVELATPDSDGYSINLDDPRLEYGLREFEAKGVIAGGETERVLNG